VFGGRVCSHGMDASAGMSVVCLFTRCDADRSKSSTAPIFMHMSVWVGGCWYRWPGSYVVRTMQIDTYTTRGRAKRG